MRKGSLSIIIVKILLAVIIFTGIGTIIIGGGYLIRDYYKDGGNNKIVIPTVQEITITTDKTEYELGENVRIMFQNNLKKDIILSHCKLSSFPVIQKFENNKWDYFSGTKLWEYPDYCEFKINANNQEIYIWDQKDNFNKLLLPGIYRVNTGLIFVLGVDEKIEDDIKTYLFISNEFTIKEKVKYDTPNWQIYRNEEFGFEVKYPEDAVIISEEMDKIKIGIPTLNAEIYEEYLLIGVRKNSNSNCSNPLSTIIQKTETVTSNDIEFVKETGTKGAAGSFYKSISYSMLKNNSCFNLSFVVSAKSVDVNISQEEETFNQILSTFKFTEK